LQNKTDLEFICWWVSASQLFYKYLTLAILPLVDNYLIHFRFSWFWTREISSPCKGIIFRASNAHLGYRIFVTLGTKFFLRMRNSTLTNKPHLKTSTIAEKAWAAAPRQLQHVFVFMINDRYTRYEAVQEQNLLQKKEKMNARLRKERT